MRAFLGVFTLIAMTGACAAWGALDDAKATQLRGALDTLALGHDAEAAKIVVEQVQKPETTQEDWHAFYAAYFEEQVFAAGHAEFWQTAINAVQESNPAEAVALAQASGQFAAEALAAAAAVEPRDLDSFERALQWLANTGAWLGMAQIAPLRDALGVALEARPLNLEAMLQSQETRARALAMQACLTLSAYFSEGLAPGMAVLPPSTTRFRTDTGLWLFDNGALTQAHLGSLASLYAALPAELHRVEVLLAPARLGLDAAQAGLTTQGFVLDIDLLPMEASSDPSEFIPRVGYKTAPGFTLTAATQLMRVVQEVQFAARPHLALWRNEILARAGSRDEYYLRRFIPADTYIHNPGELLPLSSFLWFLDSERAFLMAMEMMKVKVSEPLEALLLLADTLSGGGANTLVFSTSEAGIVQSTLTPIQRSALPGGVTVVSGLVMGGQRWHFEMNASGGVQNYYREYAP
jgi:hypothetical protein